MKLLTVGNPKIAKGEKLGYMTSILHLAPSWLSGFNTCPMATAGCSAACLNTAGRGGIIKRGETTNAIQKARIAKTLRFFNERDAFMTQLVKEINNAIKLAAKHDLIPVFRLNGTSDIRWETIAVAGASNIFELFPTVQFYDYTKIPNRRNIPANYDLTFSLAEDNDRKALAARNLKMNIAVVFKSVPSHFLVGNVMVPVIDGDASDLRFLDPKGVIIGLKAKGKAKNDTTGFVR